MLNNNVKITFGKTLNVLRTAKNLSMEQLAEILSELLGRTKQLSVQTINAWEHGYKAPTMETLITIADFFDCTVDSLLGRSSTNALQQGMDESDILRKNIRPEDLKYYDGYPVYISFHNEAQRKSIGNQYGIIDANSRTVYTKSGTFLLDKKAFSACHFYAQNPFNNFFKPMNGKHVDSVEELTQIHTVKVQMISPQSKLVSKRLDGIYQNDTENRCLRNQNNILPYDGLNVIYHALIMEN